MNATNFGTQMLSGLYGRIDTFRRSKSRMNIILVVIAALIFICMSIFVPRFFTVNNLMNILVQTSSVGLLTLGITFVLITGGMDLSLPSIMAASAVIGASYMKQGGSPVVGALVMVIISVGCGAVNGLAVSKAKMIPFVVTLSTMVLGSGLAVWYTKAESISSLPSGYIDVLTGRIGPIPVPAIILIVFAVIAHIVLSKTIYGRWVYATGINERTARVSGIPTSGVLLSVYMVSGLFAGLAAVVLTARLGSASASMGGDTLVMDVISSAVIGGVSIYGGLGTIPGAVFGSLFITIISNSMNLLGITYYTTLMIKGLVIVLVTALDTLRTR
ncbi:MAG TPA: ABC transporter permease [Candidatus Nitrosocosmicus sp.]|nr:ABC transporter permease [Candidatus Nitrosocosmicus sp.]